MSMSHKDIPELDTRGLRQFGLILGGILALFLGMLLPFIRAGKFYPVFPWIVIGTLVIAWALIAPDTMRSLYNVWMRVALVISNIVNTIILAIVFFVVITPMGVVMRLRGKDPMRRTIDEHTESYRVMSKVIPKNHVERPY